MIDKDGLILLMGLLIVVLLFLFVGNNGSVRVPKIGKSKPSGKVVEVTGPDGRKHKAVLLPEKKKPEPQRRSGIKWKYR